MHRKAAAPETPYLSLIVLTVVMELCVTVALRLTESETQRQRAQLTSNNPGAHCHWPDWVAGRGA